jgi:MFS family permease
LIFIILAVTIANVGSSGAGGQGGGPMNPVEQALLAEKCAPANRNKVFATNSFVGSMCGSLGALVSGLPQHLQETQGWQPIASYKPLFALTILFSLVLLYAYSRIDEQHVYHPREKKQRKSARPCLTGVPLTITWPTAAGPKSGQAAHDPCLSAARRWSSLPTIQLLEPSFSLPL